MELFRLHNRLNSLGWILLTGMILAGCGNLPVSGDQPVQPTRVIQFATSVMDSAELELGTPLVDQPDQIDSTPVKLTSIPTQLPCGDDWCVTFGHFILLRPIGEDYNDQVERSYPYGSTENQEHAPHHGVEFSNPTGTPVLAVADGKVVVAGSDHNTSYGEGTDFYGNLVMIAHQLSQYSTPFYSLYGHLSEVNVRVGDTVKTGNVIGKVGKTGVAMGSHLHFEVRVGGEGYFDVRNPELWLAPHTGNGVLTGKIINPEGEIRYFPDVKVEFLGSSNKTLIYRPEPYADPNLKRDEFYQEVFVVGDLPAGRYRVSFTPPGVSQVLEVEIYPGKVTEVVLHAKY